MSSPRSVSRDALEHILGLKAKLGLHRKKPEDLVPPVSMMKSVVGCPEHKAMAWEIADKSITLVKDKDHVFPLTPAKYKRILIVPVKGASGGAMAAMAASSKGPSTAEKVAQRLRRRGFEVEIYENP